jgi:hypothetical protein
MRLSRIFWTLIALAALSFAQPPDSEKMARKIIPVHNVNVDHLANLVSIPGISVKADNQMGVLVVTGPEPAVATIEEMVKKLDVPPPAPALTSLELTGYLVSGSLQSRADDIPADLAGTVKQLHSLFPYKSYRVLDTFVLRGTASPTQHNSTAVTSGILPGTNSEYHFAYNAAIISPTTLRSVRLNNMSLAISTPTGERDEKGKQAMRSVGISAEVDIPEGQKVVVGKSNFTGGDDALILVLSVKILDKQ